MNDQTTKRITLALDLRVQPWHKRTYRVSLGSIVEEGPKAQAVERVKQRALIMLASTDLASIVRVGLADGFIYVLHSSYDGTYEIRGFHPKAGETGTATEIATRTFEPGKRVEAVVYFDEMVAGRHERAVGRRSADADASLRELARKAGLSDEGDFADVAQRLGLAYAEVQLREEQAATGERVAALSAGLVSAGSSVEGAALVRLLGLRQDAPASAVRKAAEAIVGSTRAGKYGGTLKELREQVGGHDVVETISIRPTTRNTSARRWPATSSGCGRELLYAGVILHPLLYPGDPELNYWQLLELRFTYEQKKKRGQSPRHARSATVVCTHATTRAPSACALRMSAA